MWLSHVVNRYNVVLMLQLLSVLPETMIHVRAHQTCEVGREKNEDDDFRWVLPYKDPCQCKKVRYGGLNTFTPKRPFKPVYVEKPLVGDNVGEIRDHYDLNCIDMTCPINASVEGETDPGQPTGMITWKTKAIGNDGEPLSVVCDPPLGFSFPIGHTNITCLAEDQRGNNKSCAFDVSVIDKESPEITQCPLDQETITSPGATTAMVTYLTPNATDNSDDVISLICSPPSESEFHLGRTNVSCLAEDSSGNNGTCNFEIHVIDKEPPVFSTQCPADRQMVTSPRNATAMVTYQTPNSTDNSGEEVDVVCYPVSQSEFPIGLTTVTCVARDGNKEPPVFSTQCPADRQMVTSPRNATAMVTYQTPNATDNSGEEVDVVCYPVSQSEFPIGLTTVTCVARDGSENNRTCDFKIEVNGK
ncbi:hyalin-like [Amphiura filiformis]|uniref:hyalin-like n=1 Tax=Amphiura filiformis TaxID=82378 RepID=UPI003B21FDF9